MPPYAFLHDSLFLCFSAWQKKQLTVNQLLKLIHQKALNHLTRFHLQAVKHLIHQPRGSDPLRQTTIRLRIIVLHHLIAGSLSVLTAALIAFYRLAFFSF